MSLPALDPTIYPRAARPALALLAGLLALILATIPAAAQARIQPKIEQPTLSKAGSFEGTWYRIEPGSRQAIQLRRAPDNKGWEIRFHWVSPFGLDLDTQFEPLHQFSFRGFPGSMALKADPARTTESEIVIPFRREQEGERKSKLLEVGDVSLYRTGTEGRELVWWQQDMQLTVTIGEPTLPDETEPRTRTETRFWVFQKASKRLIPWEEIRW